MIEIKETPELRPGDVVDAIGFKVTVKQIIRISRNIYQVTITSTVNGQEIETPLRVKKTQGWRIYNDH